MQARSSHYCYVYRGKSLVTVLCFFSSLCACGGWTIDNMKYLSMNDAQKQRTGSRKLSQVSSLRPSFPILMTPILLGCLSSLFISLDPVAPHHLPQSSSSSSSSSSPQQYCAFVAHAACLQGDTSKECIGVYKIPNDGKTILPSMTGNDLQYVPPLLSPKSVQDALQILQAQRKALEDIQQVVMEGRFEEAGIKLLNVLPRVTTAGRLMVQFMSSSSSSPQASSGSSSSSTSSSSSSAVVQELQQSRAQNQLDILLALLGQCDVTMGQGLRGEMGSVTMAQLSILSEVKDVIRALDDFVALVVQT